jgi:hypothetical protein
MGNYKMVSDIDESVVKKVLHSFGEEK